MVTINEFLQLAKEIEELYKLKESYKKDNTRLMNYLRQIATRLGSDSPDLVELVRTIDDRLNELGFPLKQDVNPLPTHHPQPESLR